MLCCPSCDSSALREFYSVERVPCHSCLLMSSRDEALAYPRGDVSLAFCDACGFVFNATFDPRLHEYSPRYEETQGFSPTFSRWARSLAERLAARHELRGKTVLEIGCGKGEFLIELCEAGECRGIGIDPSYVPDRNPSARERAIRFVQDFYGPRYAHLWADLICCRHTLEHIAATGEFVRSLRATVGERMDTVVFFEVPDVYRVLVEGGFWDIYYEHCSYFSAGSQARLFRRHGFDVTELALEYGDQYILQTALPARGATAARLPQENDLEALRDAVDRFPEVVRERIQYWRETMLRAADGGGRVVIWGGGSKGVALLSTTDVGEAVEYVVDINPYKQGRFMPGTGQEVISPERLVEYRPDLVIAMNPVYVPEIRKTLEEAGLHPRLLAV
jgi:SAM-dependent methyltransferase